LPVVPTSSNCPGCGNAVAPEALCRQLYVCDCGHHHRVDASVWTALLPDEGTWVEQWTDLRPNDLLDWKLVKSYEAQLSEAEKEGLNESVRTGTCEVAGHPVRLAVFDFRFVGGTLSRVGGERLVRSLEAAAETHTPFVLVTASGGARMQEGLLSLMQMAKVNAAVGRLHASRTAYFSVLTDPTYGGTAASLALLADVNLAEPGARIGFTGPRVIKQATHADLKPDFQTSEFLLDHGQVDMVVHRHELRAAIAKLLAFHP